MRLNKWLLTVCHNYYDRKPWLMFCVMSRYTEKCWMGQTACQRSYLGEKILLVALMISNILKL